MASVNFTKMHGLGNDFVVIDAMTQPLKHADIPIEQLAHRHLGIGFDQLLWVDSSIDADIGCRIFNADGSEAEQCGNGLRCVASFVYDRQLVKKKAFTIATKAGIFPVQIHENGWVQVSMGMPFFEPQAYDIPLDNDSVSLMLVSMGNPHAIVEVSSLHNLSLNNIAQQIAGHAIFPQGVNVGFMQRVSRQEIWLRTVERGVGETLACGSNACAAVVAGIYNHSLDSSVKVKLPLGELQIEWPNQQQPVMMTGPVATVFEGNFFTASPD